VLSRKQNQRAQISKLETSKYKKKEVPTPKKGKLEKTIFSKFAHRTYGI